MRFGSMWADPVVLLGSAVSAFGLIGIVDAALAWRAFFTNFLVYWARFREAVFSIIPFHLPSDLKDLIIINLAAASIMLRSGYVLEKNGFKVRESFRRMILGTLFGSVIYTILFYPVLAPLRNAITGALLSMDVTGVLDLIRGIIEQYVAAMFFFPFIALPFLIATYVYDGLKGNYQLMRAGYPYAVEEWTVSIVILSNAMLVLAFVAAIILLCAKW